MSDTLPSEGPPDASDGGRPRVLWLDDEETERLIGSLACDTARQILSALHESPATTTELGDLVNTSVQNVRHHLGNLSDAGLVRVDGTRYSEKGREMKVYAPADTPFVVCVGGDSEDRAGFADAISSFLE